MDLRSGNVEDHGQIATRGSTMGVRAESISVRRRGGRVIAVAAFAMLVAFTSAPARAASGLDDLGWGAIAHSNDPAAFDGFVRMFPQSSHRAEAEARAKALRAPAATPADDPVQDKGVIDVPTPQSSAPKPPEALLLEASANGATGAVPFSGTVAWTKGTDELGQPTLVAQASVPARDLKVSVVIRHNNDPSLPASHLMEVNFTVGDHFKGQGVASLPGVLMKDEELVQGTPLIGASARVVGNSFLFALSAPADDAKTNTDLLTRRHWMDFALIYATGQRAIITLEKDDAAQKLFADVFAAWRKLPAAATN